MKHTAVQWRPSAPAINGVSLSEANSCSRPRRVGSTPIPSVHARNMPWDRLQARPAPHPPRIFSRTPRTRSLVFSNKKKNKKKKEREEKQEQTSECAMREASVPRRSSTSVMAYVPAPTSSCPARVRVNCFVPWCEKKRMSFCGRTRCSLDWRGIDVMSGRNSLLN